MRDAAVLLWVFLMPFVVVCLGVGVIVAIRHPRQTPTPAGGWQWPQPQAMTMTMHTGPVCGCGGPLVTVTVDPHTGMPSVLRCQVCGADGTTGPWLRTRERL